MLRPFLTRREAHMFLDEVILRSEDKSVYADHLSRTTGLPRDRFGEYSIWKLRELYWKSVRTLGEHPIKRGIEQ